MLLFSIFNISNLKSTPTIKMLNDKIFSIYKYIYIYFYSHQLSLLSPDSYGLAMAMIWRWFNVLTMVFFLSLMVQCSQCGFWVIVWFLGHGVVFLGHSVFFFFFLFFCYFLWLRWIWLVVGGGDGGWMWWLCYR